jgi:hypothetical protein
MARLLAPLAGLARHGRIVLVLGLLAGLALPELARAMRPWIAEMVAGLLFLAALRVGPRQAVGALGDIGRSFFFVALFQLVLPLAAAAAFLALGWLAAAPALGVVLMLAAAPVTASPSIAILTGNDPAPALRQLVMGTALLPLTVIPVFWLTPALGSAAAVLEAAGRLMLLIAAAAGLAFTLRMTVLQAPSPQTMQAIDGLAALALAIVVIGLMSAVGPALWSDPTDLAITMAVAFAASFLVQILVATILRRSGHPASAPAIAIAAGNRNVALFLTVLPPATADHLLLFIGCYQVPMYLTPLLLGRFYRV